VTLGLVNVLRVEVGESADAVTSSEHLLQQIKGYVDDAELLRTRGHELTFTLPTTSAEKFSGKFL